MYTPFFTLNRRAAIFLVLGGHAPLVPPLQLREVKSDEVRIAVCWFSVCEFPNAHNRVPTLKIVWSEPQSTILRLRGGAVGYGGVHQPIRGHGGAPGAG